MTLTVDVKKVTLSLGKIGNNSGNGRVLFKGVASYHLSKIFVTFQNEGKRDEHEAWKPFADQYTRKTDGAVVPAWGGVPKLRGKGMVKGRKRPSGRRITSNSKLLQDTGTGRMSFYVILLENQRIVYGSRLPYMADHNYGQHRMPKREIIYFTNSDLEHIKVLTNNWVVNEVLKV